jgi:hypothetical protein
MSTRLINREFVVQQGYETLPAVSLAGSWSNFMNTYAVWPENKDSVTIRRTLTLQAGEYFVTGAVDNSGSVNINGQYNINLYNFDTNVSRTSVGNSTLVNHQGGPMSITISATNTGGPRGVAVTISKAVALYGFSNVSGTYGIGDLVWSTRTPGTLILGRYLVTMPFKASIAAYVWGAGGGGGGMDAGTQGGLGSPGLYNTRTFQVNKGDVLEVFVGDGGNGGSSNSGGAPGGAGGLSRINVNGDGTKSFNGGAGTAAGPRPYSGGGGGGGGASGILVNNVPLIVAAGGGGGGGAGNDGNGSAQYARRDAGITKNDIGAAGSDYRGENGQAKGGDGGGAGGGGGGYPGGQGGAVFGGDASGFAGQCGGNFPVFSATTGTNTAYYKSGFAGGGARGGGTGQNGRVYLQIQPIGLLSTKVAGDWKQVDDVFVKVSGSWKSINQVFVKVGNTWKQIANSGQNDITLTENGSDYGVVSRPYS